jgi:hypothetical protein
MTDTPLDPVAQFLADEQDDRNAWWYLTPGDMRNLFDAACEQIERLTAENAQTGAELARFATEGEWTTEYSVTGRGYWEAERCHLDRFERQVWRGKARALEETTE